MLPDRMEPMTGGGEFSELLAAARAGDEEAMARIVARYEPEVRMVARMRLGAALRPHLDSVDLLQSVHRSLLVGLRENRFDISTPGKLVALAMTIVRRKAARHWRKLQRQQRLSGRRMASGAESDPLADLPADGPDPAGEYELAERLSGMLEGLDPLDRELVNRRIEGYSTVQIARELDLDADVLRVRLSRLRRKLREQGFEEDWC